MNWGWAKRGVRCVCLDAEMIRGLEVGAIYTIADLSVRPGTFKRRNFPELVCVTLAEVNNPDSGDRDGSYALQRFRPLSDAPAQIQKKTVPPVKTRAKELEYA